MPRKFFKKSIGGQANGYWDIWFVETFDDETEAETDAYMLNQGFIQTGFSDWNKSKVIIEKKIVKL
jgi:hypothetical protein